MDAPQPVEHRRHRLADEYESKAAVYYTGERADVRARVPDSVKRLLDVGCGNGEFGYQLKRQRPGIHVTGIELTTWAEKAIGRLDEVLHVDTERDDLDGLGTYDCITFNDVLEHLFDPWQALRRLGKHLEPGGYVIASSPNLRFFEVLKALILNKRFDYAEAGVMDRTHVRFFTLKTFPEMFESVGLKVLDTGGTGADPQLPFKFALLNKLCFNALDDTRYPQVYCVAQKPR